MKNKFLTYKGTPITILVDSLAETLQAKREWDSMSKLLKEIKKKSCQLRILELAELILWK